MLATRYWLLATFFDSLLFLVELGVERQGARGEIDFAHECRGFAGSVHPIHPAVLPLDTERAPIPDIVQRDDNVLELDIPVPQRPKIPVAPRLAEADVPAEHTHCAVPVAPPHVLHVGMENPL